MLDDERESAWMYDRLAAVSRSETTSATLRTLAEAERRHALHWAERLGNPALAEEPVHPTLRVRALILLAHVAGVDAVLPRLRAAELAEIGRYDADPEARALADEERAHRAMLGALTDGTDAVEAEHGFASASAASTFRAALFGLNDGLVSNLSLVAGVAGAAIDSDAVLVAGISGWLAGAFSMGAGEYVSVRSQRELFEHQLEKERLELELDPEEELNELVGIYERKGISSSMARELATEIMKDPETALDTHAREELGLDPDNLGAPWPAAIGSFIAFSFGAAVPVLPFIVSSGYTALVAAIVFGIIMLGLVGMLTSLLTGRHPLYAGGRMVLIGVVATAVTFGIGSAIPVDL
jgi:VIT1/CCC1 family predicted Fe2+/Mn2+ transporter